METTIIKVPLGKIESVTDRTHGGEGNIDTLAQSIKAIGIIHPPAVKELTDKAGYYRIIAGRRRIAAVKSLGWKSVEVILHPEKANDEAIALAENVNREDMHPLDEAEKFKRMIDSGKKAEEVAKYFARSVSGIHQRVRLTNLISGIKTMFRDGRINLSGAALISSLPEDDQEKFFKKYGEKHVDKYEITSFIGSVQKLNLKHIADKKCEKCKNRTFNSTPGLFEDFKGLEDVCFDQECYCGKWKDLIGKLIAEVPGKTNSKIIINRGVPEFLPKKTKTLTVGEVEYTLLSQSDHSWNETKKKGDANTAYLISLEWHQSSGSYDIKAARVEYKVFKRQSYTSSSSSSEPKDPVHTFMIDLLPEILPDEKKDIAERMQKKHEYPYGFFRRFDESLMQVILDKRLREEDKENMAALYLAAECGGTDDKGKWHEIDPDYQELFDMVFGQNFALSQLPTEPWVEKMFRLLIAISVKTDSMPDLRDGEDVWKETETSLFWRFAQMTREEYTALYQKTLTLAIMQELNEEQPQVSDTEDSLDSDDE